MTVSLTSTGKLFMEAVQPSGVTVTIDPGEIERVDTAIFMGVPCARVVTRRGKCYVRGTADEILKTIREARAVAASDEAVRGRDRDETDQS